MTQLSFLNGIDINTLLLFVGAILVMLEAVIPGAQFIVVGMALLVTGLIGFSIPVIGSSLPFLFVTFVAVSVVIFILYSKFEFYQGDNSGYVETSDSSDLVGTTGEVIETVTQSSGKVDLNTQGFSSKYQARTEFTETIEEGSTVEVIDGGGGNIVTVQKMYQKDEIDKELEKETGSQDSESLEVEKN